MIKFTKQLDKKNMSNTKTILVTGGAGYIGSHTIIELIEKTNYKIISADNFSNSSAKTFERIKHITGREIINHNIDLCNQQAVENLFVNEENIVGIIHFAAHKFVGESVENPHKYYRNNINSLLNLLECCLKFNVNSFIFSSSCSVYGNINQLPVREDTPFNKAESPYAYTKQVGEEIIKDYTRAFSKLQCISLRYFNPVGAHVSGKIGEDPINKPSNLVPAITQTAIGKLKQMSVHGNNYTTRDGTCIRDYIHVTDIANAHVLALQQLISNKNKGNNNVYNLGTGNGVSVLEAITAFEKISGINLNYVVGAKRAGDVEAIYSDTTKSSSELGWSTRFDLDVMMETAWKWEQYCANGK
jgi:UDP-glucose 4-epimerase